jgi:hypothetical protein
MVGFTRSRSAVKSSSGCTRRPLALNDTKQPRVSRRRRAGGYQ